MLFYYSFLLHVAGMSADEIAAVRSSFLPSIDHFGAQQGLVRGPDETAITFRFRLEEMWMDAQGEGVVTKIERKRLIK